MLFYLGSPLVVNRTDVVMEERTGDPNHGGQFYIAVFSGQPVQIGICDAGGSQIAFNHADASTSQRWLLLTADEVGRFGQAMGETVSVRNLDFAQKGSLRVLGGNGMVNITAVGNGADVTIYSFDGRTLRQLYIQQDANAVVRLPRGIYLVGDQKVMVR